MDLNSLIQQRTDLWRGKVLPGGSAVSTGFPQLDAQLAGNGWPLGGITEILCDSAGWGMSLVLPGLARLSQWLVLVRPPHVPYAPGFAGQGVTPSRLLLLTPEADKECLWAMEQTLRSKRCDAVLAWPPRLSMTELRRLQLAAETGRSAGFLFRPQRAADQASPAALRLQVRPAGDRLEVKILKRRGGWESEAFYLETVSRDSRSRDG